MKTRNEIIILLVKEISEVALKTALMNEKQIHSVAQTVHKINFFSYFFPIPVLANKYRYYHRMHSYSIYELLV